MTRPTYRVRPWRGLSSGKVYFDIERIGLIFSHKVLTCFSEQEANEMIVKLGCWDQGKPTTAHPSQEWGRAE